MDDEVIVKVLGVDLPGNLFVPRDSKGLVIFAHGNGSGIGRKSPRNIYISSEFNKQGIATMLFDLLTAEEDKKVENRFNIELLTDRLVGVTKWCMENEKINKVPIGYFGASTGAAAALSAAAYWGEAKIKAVVSRGGRPDLTGDVIDLVETPTLLIVGSEDKQGINNNRQAYIHLGCEKKTEVIQGATHLFEEEGTLEKVAVLSIRWYLRNFEKEK